MNRQQLKYYLKQLMKPVSLIALAIGFVGIIVGAAGLLLAVHYGRSLHQLEQQARQLQRQQAELAVKENQQTALPVKYQVAEGDSTWKLAQKFYGDGRHYQAIERANNLRAGEWLAVGSEIVIPRLDEQPGQLDQVVTPSPSTSSATISSSENYRLEPLTSPSASGEKYEKYVVQPGDSLWFISLKYLGSGYSWTKLYQLNRDVVGANPDLIYPGTVLRLPTAEK
jgi:nucleoid-associated protein YgaU